MFMDQTFVLGRGFEGVDVRPDIDGFPAKVPWLLWRDWVENSAELCRLESMSRRNVRDDHRIPEVVARVVAVLLPVDFG